MERELQNSRFLLSDSKICEHCQGLLASVESSCYKVGEQGHSSNPDYQEFDSAHDVVAAKQCAHAGCRLCTLFWHNSELEASHLYPDNLQNAWTKCAAFSHGHEDDGIRLVYEVFYSEQPGLRPQDERVGYPVDLRMVLIDGTCLSDRLHNALWACAQPRYHCSIAAKANFPGDTVESLFSVTSLNTMSDETLAKAKAWMSTCDKHAFCSRWSQLNDTLQTLPSRLLEVSMTAGEKPFVRLVYGKDTSQDCRYVTLSYCWGGISPITLRQDNLRELAVAIPWESLPKTLQDASWLITQLGFSYLWVDALCIIQDSSMDWSTEAAKMKTVYANSSLNIMADHGFDSKQGLFRPRQPEVLRPFVWQDSRQDSGVYRLCYVERFMREVFQAPLNGRAWVVQERFLAPRALHFGEKQVFWECAELTAAEALPDSVSFHLPNVQSPKRLSGLAMTCLTDATGGFEIYDIWDRFVHIYAFSDLSYATDRSIAISGLASIICHHLRLSEADYLCGMWRPRFVQELTWYVLRWTDQVSNTRLTKHTVPSWSWLSVDGGIVAGTRWRLYRQLEKDLVQTVTQLLEANVSTRGYEPFGLVTGGYVKLRGPLCKTTLSRMAMHALENVDAQRQYIMTLGEARLMERSAFEIEIDDNTEEGLNLVLDRDLYLVLVSVGYEHSNGGALDERMGEHYRKTGIPQYVKTTLHRYPDRSTDSLTALCRKTLPLWTIITYTPMLKQHVTSVYCCFHRPA